MRDIWPRPALTLCNPLGRSAGVTTDPGGCSVLTCCKAVHCAQRVHRTSGSLHSFGVHALCFPWPSVHVVTPTATSWADQSAGPANMVLRLPPGCPKHPDSSLSLSLSLRHYHFLSEFRYLRPCHLPSRTSVITTIRRLQSVSNLYSTANLKRQEKTGKLSMFLLGCTLTNSYDSNFLASTNLQTVHCRGSRTTIIVEVVTRLNAQPSAWPVSMTGVRI